VKTLEWAQLQVNPVLNVVGSFVLRADCYLKPKVALESWVDRGISEGQYVFPFIVWERITSRSDFSPD
jgi:hypothetical protein